MNPEATTVGAARRKTHYAVAGSVVGTSHHNKGTERQDRVLLAGIAGDLVVCLADGLSSARYGGFAAEIAVREAMKLLAGLRVPEAVVDVDDGTDEDLDPKRAPLQVPSEDDAAASIDWPTALRCAVIAARRAVDRLAQIGRTSSDFNTTLTVVALTSKAVHVAQVGDGFVVVWDRWAPESARVLAHKVSIEDDISLVIPLTSSDALTSMLIESAPLTEASHVLVSSDGIAPILLERWSPLVPSPNFLRALTRELDAGGMDHAGLTEFLKSDLINTRVDDDKTVVLARRAPLGTSTGQAAHELHEPVNDVAPLAAHKHAAPTQRKVTTEELVPSPTRQSASTRPCPASGQQSPPPTYNTIPHKTPGDRDDNIAGVNEHCDEPTPHSATQPTEWLHPAADHSTPRAEIRCRTEHSMTFLARIKRRFSRR
jgi:hypothetical protein